jgi:hypothetical protein
MTRAFYYDEKAPKAKGVREYSSVNIDGGHQFTPLAAN